MTAFHITLLASGEQRQVQAKHWQDALEQVDRLDAVVIVPWRYGCRNDMTEAVAACRLTCRQPRPFPRVCVAPTAEEALADARADLEVLP